MAGKLTALKAKALTQAGRYGDGQGLWLQVRDADHRSWLFRYVSGGRQRQMGLGPFPDVSLAEAREAAAEARRRVRQGHDPIEERRKKAARDTSYAITFRQVADRYIAAHETAWRNTIHRQQWRGTLDFACEQIGKTPVTAIATGDVMAVLEPIWGAKPQTASRLRGRIESVLDYAAARGWRSGENPARWRGHLAKLLPTPGKIAKVKHHAALPWSEIGAFTAELRDEDGVAARALEFTILTAARTGEVMGATWSEIDMRAGAWVVPAGRTKGDREHRVPLSAATLRVLSAMAPLRNRSDSYIFPGGKADRSLSGTAMRKVLGRMRRPELTVHGFRSTFRDWCSEATNHPREVAEAALAHVLGDKVEAAYRRGDLMEKRVRLMSDWAAFCDRAAPAACVVPLHAVRA